MTATAEVSEGCYLRTECSRSSTMSKTNGAYGANISTDTSVILPAATDGKKATRDQNSAPDNRDSKICAIKLDEVTAIRGPEKKKCRAKEKAKQVRFISLFRFADILDVFLMMLGTLLAMAVGIATPLTIYYYGQLISQLVVHHQVKHLNQSLVAEIQSANDSDSICYQQILTRPRESLGSLIGSSGDGISLVKAVFVPEVVGWIAITASVIIFGYFAMFLWILTTERQIRRIRLAFIRAIMNQDISWFDVNDTQALNAHMLSDMEKLRQGLGDKITTFVRWMTTFFGCFIMCLLQSWKLALVVIATIPLLVLVIAFMGSAVRTFVQRELKAHANTGAVATEMLAAIRTVVAFGGESKAIKKYQIKLSCAKLAGIRRAAIAGITQAFIWLYRYGSVSLAFWYGGKLVREECIGTGLVLEVFFIIVMGITSLSNAVPLLEDFSSACLAAASIFRIIDQDSSSCGRNEVGLKFSVTGEIEFENVVFSYLKGNGGRQVINGMSVKIGAGQTVALVGPKGCGKSTVLNLLQRIYEPKRGLVMIGGVDIGQLSIGSLREQIGFVGQDALLFNASIEDNIRLGGVNVSDASVEQALREANCVDFINQLPQKLKTHVGDNGTQLSASEKHRIAIARALVCSPRILLLDEVTSGLDPESEAIVQAVLEKVSKGRTTIVVPHRLSTAQRADVIVGIRDGKVVESGTHDELMSSQGLYYSLRIQQQNESGPGVVVSSDGIIKQAEGNAIGAEQQPPAIDVTPLTHSLESVADLGSRSSTDSDELVNQISGPEHEDTGVFSRYGAMRASLRSLRGVIPEPVFEDELNAVMKPKTVVEEFKPDRAATASGTSAQVSFGRILQLNRPEASFLAVGSIASLVLGAAQPIFSIALSTEFGTFAIMFRPLEREQLIDFWSGMMVVIGAGAAAAAVLQSIAFAISGERLTERLRLNCFRGMIKQDIAWFEHEENNVGRLTTLLSTDASLVKAAVGPRIGLIAQSVACILTALIVAYTGDWRLALVATAIFPITVSGALLPGRVLQSHASKRRVVAEEGNKIYKEIIMNIKTVVLLSKEEHFLKRIEAHFDQLYRCDVSMASAYGIAYSFSQCIFTGCFAVCYSFGAYLVGAYGVPPYILLRIFSSLVVGGITVSQIIAGSPDFIKARAAATKIVTFLEQKSNIDSLGTSGLRLDSCRGSLSFSNVTFRYPTCPTAPVFQGLSMDVSPDESLALVIPSGCGKNAVAALLERFYDPLEGNVALDGHSLKNINIQSLRRNLGVISHEAILFSDSVAENIAYGDNERHPTMIDIIAAARQANIHDFICSLPQGYETKLGGTGPTLSDGQKQCLAIARVLVRKPKVVLIDDVAMAYGTDTQLVQEALKKVQQGSTCIIITHHMSTIQNAHRIGVISDGRIVEIGTHDELMSLGKLYFSFVSAQES